MIKYELTPIRVGVPIARYARERTILQPRPAPHPLYFPMHLSPIRTIPNGATNVISQQPKVTA